MQHEVSNKGPFFAVRRFDLFDVVNGSIKQLADQTIQFFFSALDNQGFSVCVCIIDNAVYGLIVFVLFLAQCFFLLISQIFIVFSFAHEQRGVAFEGVYTIFVYNNFFPAQIVSGRWYIADFYSKRSGIFRNRPDAFVKTLILSAGFIFVFFKKSS